MIEDWMKKANDGVWDLLNENRKKIWHLLGTDVIMDRMGMLMDVYMPAMVHHQKIFPKYRGINRGKTVVIVATGPTLDYYKPMPDVVHMGVNAAIWRKDIPFNYLFSMHYTEDFDFMKELLNYEDAVKFLGIYFRMGGLPIPVYLTEREDVESFYIDNLLQLVYGTRVEKCKKTIYPLDISVSPLMCYRSIVHCAMQFALWTHPSKIYLVGVDCSGRGNSHAKGLNYETWGDWGRMDFRTFIRPWRKVKNWIDAYYPDIEIVSLNPVGLKGIFKDEYTDEYINRMR